MPKTKAEDALVVRRSKDGQLRKTITFKTHRQIADAMQQAKVRGDECEQDHSQVFSWYLRKLLKDDRAKLEKAGKL